MIRRELAKKCFIIKITIEIYFFETIIEMQ